MLRRCLPMALLFLGLATEARASVFYPTSFTLANGLQLIVVPNHLAPAVSQMVWYKVGSADEVPGKTGLAHYLEHLMFRGTANVAPGQFSKTIAAQGGNDNAFTAYDYTAFFETVASDRLPMIMQMEADRMRNLRILPETATPELSVVLNERQERTDNNPQGKFEEKMRLTLMPHHPYGVPVIGWKKEIERLSAADATRFYQTHYAPNNAVVIISGDVTPDEVMRLATSVYGAIPKGDVGERRALPTTPTPQKRRIEMTDIGVEQPQLQWDAVVPSYTTQKGSEAYALEVLSEAFDRGEAGILYRELAAGQGLASAIGSNYDPDARGDAVFTIEAIPNPGKTPQALEKALAETLRRLADQGIDDKTIADAKERLQREAVFARDSLMTPGYAFGMALTTGHSVADVEQWPARIKAVTPADVNAALRALVSSPRTLTGLLLPEPHASRAAREAARPVISHDMSIR
ncbi:MAG: insulinase family protein [Pseudomonadota bacterium]|nr:insulinase family protein [Pseudomonadota bacterium]